jgi:hypothetical protein
MRRYVEAWERNDSEGAVALRADDYDLYTLDEF